eukprot:1549623-Rhodomonas_salina.1
MPRHPLSVSAATGERRETVSTAIKPSELRDSGAQSEANVRLARAVTCVWRQMEEVLGERDPRTMATLQNLGLNRREIKSRDRSPGTTRAEMQLMAEGEEPTRLCLCEYSSAIVLCKR